MPSLPGPVDGGDPAHVSRCETCRLIIGPGRAVKAGVTRRNGRTAGTAAGALVARARRAAAASITGCDPGVASGDLRRVAEQLGVATDRLRMLDYQAAWAREPSLASLGQIIGAFGSWKAARQAAGVAPRPAGR